MLLLVAGTIYLYCISNGEYYQIMTLVLNMCSMNFFKVVYNCCTTAGKNGQRYQELLEHEAKEEASKQTKDRVPRSSDEARDGDDEETTTRT